MNGFEFTASIIDALAWPASVLILAWILKKPLQKLLNELKSFRYRDVEMDFGQQMHAIESGAEKAGLALSDTLEKFEDASQISEQLLNEASRFAGEFPAPAINQAWQAIVFELSQSVERLSIIDDERITGAAYQSIELLDRRGHLDSATRSLLDRMMKLRNLAVQGMGQIPNVTGNDAKEYVRVARGLVEKLKSLGT